MQANIKLWSFIVLLPLIAAISFDLYVNFYKDEENRAKIEAMDIANIPPINPSEEYRASDFGYLLVKYIPSVYEGLRGMYDEATWRQWVDPILRLYTVVVAAIPAAAFFLCLLVFQGLKKLPDILGKKKGYKNDKKFMKNDPLDKRSKSEPFKYKRR